MKRALISLASLILLSSAAYSQKASEIAKIDSYVAAVKKISGSKRSPKIVIADTKDYEAEKSTWQRFASEAALEKFREKTETYSIAYNWRNKGKLVQSNFTDFSPSGDWAEYTFHYFRPDGSVAKIESEIRTFNGDYIILHTFYVDEKGKQLKKTTRYLDLQTRRPKKKPSGDMFGESSNLADHFTSTNKLPFASLLGIK